MNVVLYIPSGLDNYSSLFAWPVAVALNAFGTLWNIIAALGMFERLGRHN